VAERTITSRHIHRYRSWKKNILSYIGISFAGVGVFLVLFLAVGFAPLNLPVETVSLFTTILLGGLGVSAGALALCILILVIISFWGDRLERGSIGSFLINPAIPYEEKRRALGVITGSGYLPETREEQIWYNLVLQHWSELYQHGKRVIPPVLTLIGHTRLSMDGEGRTVVEHLADLLHFTGEEGTAALLDCVKGEDLRACANAALILGELHEDRVLEPLLQRISTENGGTSDLQQSLVVALGRFQDPRIILPLLQWIDSANPSLQRAALLSLRAQGDTLLRAAWREEEDPVQRKRLRLILESLE
jgi:hypothetical protein